MAGISKRVWVFLVATSGVVPLVHAGEPPPVHYDIGLEVTQGDVEAINVRATIRTGDDGIVDFDPPTQRAAEVHAERGALDTSIEGRWRVTNPPGTEVTLSWRSPKPEPLASVDLTAWEKIIARPGTVFAFGGVFLAIPKGPSTRNATATISLPPGWQASSALGDRLLTVANLPYASYLASHELHTTSRRIGANTVLHVGSVAGLDRSADAIATLVASALNTNDGHRRSEPRDLTLNVLTFNAGEGYGSSTGGPSATLLLSRDDPSHPWLFILARDLATPRDTSGDATNAWFTRGFTGYRIANALLADGEYDNISFARHVDQTLDAYGGSPLRRAPNTRIAEDYDRIREMQDLPATRGELFAWLVDARMREATQGRKRLMNALNRMDDRTPHPGPALIAAVAAEGGGDITPLYQRYIVDGELLQLPADALGPCFAIGTVAYDYGWQVQHVFAKPAGACVGSPSVGAASAGSPSVGAASAANGVATGHRR